jgi:glyoxylase-like metal-dependent hydrolase (beta-lactamase superfamily II)
MAAAEERFGRDVKPEGIVLTHGHFDHAGNAGSLAEHWNVPIYAHRLEMPYLTGRSPYPPQDPTTGGAIGFLSRFMPSKPYDLSQRVRELPEQKIPGAEGWEWLATPGHSPGHISLFRSSDRVLIAGDAFATMDMESWSGLMTRHKVLARAGAPFNCDWDATEQSANALARLRPSVVGAGHGNPLSEAGLAERIERFATRFRRPRHGRYVREPAIADQRGVVAVPPAPFDPVPFATAAGLLVLGIALGSGAFEDERS